MNNKALTLSLVMAVLAVFFVQSYVSSIEEEQKKKFGTEVLVVTAKKDIKEMETINETMLQFKRVPKQFKEKTAIFFEKKEEDKETAKSLKELVGAIAMVPIKSGEQLTFNKIAEPSMRTGLAFQVTPGRRGFTIPVNETSGIAKLVKPGDRVDLIGVIDLGGGKANKIAKTLLQDVVVLATGRNITNNVARTIESDAFTGKEKIRSLAEDPSFSSVTLEVDPVQAQMLALVMASGESSLILSLRNNDDTERGSMSTMTYSDVLGQDLSKVRAPASRQ